MPTQDQLNILEAVDEKISKIGSTLDGFANSINSLVSKLIDIPSSLENINNKANSTSGGIGKLNSEVHKSTDLIDKLKTSISNYGSKLSETATDLENNQEAMDNINTIASTLATVLFGTTSTFSKMNNEVSVGNQSLKDYTATLDTLGNNWNKVKGIIENIPILKNINKMIPALQEAGSAPAEASSRENLLYYNLARSGQIGAGNQAEIIEDLDLRMQSFYKNLTDVADATGLSRGEAEKYTYELMKIPGAFEATTTKAGDVKTGVSLLEAAIKVARGTTGDFADVQKMLTSEFQRFGTVSDKSLKYMSEAYYLQQKLGLSYTDIEPQINQLSDAMAAYGDNTEGVIKAYGGLMSALKDVGGVGPKIMNEISQNFIGSIKNMDIAQKSFLSSQTGGSGGLKGAFEIDFLLKEGKIDQVMSKMRDALMKQFGGQIVNLEQARTSDIDAAQMTKQLSFLQQGPFGKLVQDDAQAYRLLEAFQEGITPAEIGGEEILKESMDAGNKIGERQFSVLNTVANHLANIADISLLNYYQTIRVSGEENAFTKQIRELRDEASENLSKRLIAGPTAENLPEDKNIMSLLKETANVSFNLIGGGKETITKEIQNKKAEKETYEHYGKPETQEYFNKPESYSAIPATTMNQAKQNEKPVVGGAVQQNNINVKFEPLKLEITTDGGQTKTVDAELKAYESNEVAKSTKGF
jgi:hypothetical protein